MKLVVLVLLILGLVYGITEPRRGSDVDASLEPTQKITQSFSGVDYQMKLIYNSKGKFLQEQANALGLSSADLAGVVKVESSGSGFASNGLMIIRFENHIFYNYYTNKGADSTKVAKFNQHFKMDSSARWKGHQWRPSASGAWQDFHGNQGKEWEVLRFAQGLDNSAGLMSASYGASQVMGFNYKVAGFTSVENLFLEMSGSIKAQLIGMFNFIKNNSRCYNGLKANPTDYVAFATCYNGSGQAAHYGQLIKDASASYKKVAATVGQGGDDKPAPTPSIIQKGDVVKFNSAINVRSSASTSASIVLKSAVNDQAIVLNGPSLGNGYQWFQVQFAKSGAIGWAATGSNWFQSTHALRNGDKIRFNKAINIRTAASTSAASVGVTAVGNTANITGSPQIGNGYIWFPMKLANGKTGYGALGDNWFQKI